MCIIILNIIIYLRMQRQQQTNNLINQIFRPQGFSSQNSLQVLNSSGGILGLINDLKTCHRRGLSSNDAADHKIRVQMFGENREAFGENIFRKSLLEERDFIVNLLFYLLALRICVKLILFRDQILGSHPLGEQKFELRINAQIISCLLLVCMIVMKAKVSVKYYEMDQDERKYKNQRLHVRRDGEKQQIFQENLMVGDILICETNNVIRIDGILLKSKNLVVSQAQTVLREDVKSKKQIWSYNSNQKFDKSKDPFILSGSLVIGGSGQILVCTVGPKCSFRYDKDHKGYYSDYTPTIAQAKRIMNFIENVGKIISIVLATYMSIYYLVDRYLDDNAVLSWLDLLYILKVYCGYIGMVCLLQRLKIIKSLQFFIQSNRSEKQYRIKNKATFEYLSKLDMLFIQSSTLGMRKVQQRQEIKIILDHITQISNINNFCQVKIIFEENREQIMKIFGNDIEWDCIFQPNQDIPYSSHVKSLVESTFISQTSINTFINSYLPIFKALKFQVGYLYDSQKDQNRDISPQVLQINFQKLIFNPIEQQKISKPSQTVDSYFQPVNNFWVKIQNQLFMEDILYRLFVKAFTYQNLYSVYITLYINNVLIFIVLCWFSTTVTVINLSWHLLIIIAHRYMFLSIINRITEVNEEIERKIEGIDNIKFNAILFPYYFFVINRLKFLSSLFVFFLVNGVLRTEILLNQKRPLSRQTIIKRFSQYFVGYVIVNLTIVLTQWNSPGIFYEEIDNIKYTAGLLIIYVCFAVFL